MADGSGQDSGQVSGSETTQVRRHLEGHVGFWSLIGAVNECLGGFCFQEALH